MSEIVKLGETAVQLRSGSDPWQDAAAAWLDNLKSERTRRAYLTAWKRFTAYTAVHPAAVTRAAIIGYRNEMKQAGYAPATIALHLSAVSSFYRHAVEDGLLDTNPVHGVKWPGVEPYAAVKAAVGKLTDSGGDLLLLESLGTDTEAGRRDTAVIMLLLAHGLRVGEVAQLYVGDLDGGYLRVMRKGAEVKTAVHLAPEPAAAIADYLALRGELQPGAPLFVAGDKGRAAATQLHGEYTERPLTARAIRAMLTRRCNRVFGKGHGITPHTLRHALATRADHDGAALGDISAMLGHKSTKITHTYLTRTGSRGDDLARKLAGRYAGLMSSR